MVHAIALSPIYDNRVLAVTETAEFILMEAVDPIRKVLLSGHSCSVEFITLQSDKLVAGKSSDSKVSPSG